MGRGSNLDTGSSPPYLREDLADNELSNRAKGSKGGSHAGIWGKGYPGRGNSGCEGREDVGMTRSRRLEPVIQEETSGS